MDGSISPIFASVVTVVAVSIGIIIMVRAHGLSAVTNGGNWILAGICAAPLFGVMLFIETLIGFALMWIVIGGMMGMVAVAAAWWPARIILAILIIMMLGDDPSSLGWSTRYS